MDNAPIRVPSLFLGLRRAEEQGIEQELESPKGLGSVLATPSKPLKKLWKPVM